MEILEFPCLLGVVFIPAFAICKTTKSITRAVPWESRFGEISNAEKESQR